MTQKSSTRELFPPFLPDFKCLDETKTLHPMGRSENESYLRIGLDRPMGEPCSPFNPSCFKEYFCLRLKKNLMLHLQNQAFACFAMVDVQVKELFYNGRNWIYEIAIDIELDPECPNRAYLVDLQDAQYSFLTALCNVSISGCYFKLARNTIPLEDIHSDIWTLDGTMLAVENPFSDKNLHYSPIRPKNSKRRMGRLESIIIGETITEGSQPLNLAREPFSAKDGMEMHWHCDRDKHVLLIKTKYSHTRDRTRICSDIAENAAFAGWPVTYIDLKGGSDYMESFFTIPDLTFINDMETALKFLDKAYSESVSSLANSGNIAPDISKLIICSDFFLFVENREDDPSEIAELKTKLRTAMSLIMGSSDTEYAVILSEMQSEKEGREIPVYEKSFVKDMIEVTDIGSFDETYINAKYVSSENSVFEPLGGFRTDGEDISSWNIRLM